MQKQITNKQVRLWVNQIQEEAIQKENIERELNLIGKKLKRNTDEIQTTKVSPALLNLIDEHCKLVDEHCKLINMQCDLIEQQIKELQLKRKS